MSGRKAPAPSQGPASYGRSRQTRDRRRRRVGPPSIPLPLRRRLDQSSLPDKAGQPSTGRSSKPLSLARLDAAFGIQRDRRREHGQRRPRPCRQARQELRDRTMIAFGGAPIIPRARQKLGIRRVVVPSGAGVGSAVGFLMAPVAYEVVRSWYVQLDGPLRPRVQRLVRRDARRGRGWSRPAPDAQRRNPHCRHALSRSGHEITVNMPPGKFDAALARN